MKEIRIITMGRREALIRLTDQIIEAGDDDKYYKSIAYLIGGSYSEIAQELLSVNKDIKNIRSIYQVDDWYSFINKVEKGTIHTFYHDQLWSVGYYYDSKKEKNVVENIVDVINNFAPDGEYVIIDMEKEKGVFDDYTL